MCSFYGALLGLRALYASVLCGVLDSFTYRNGFLEIAASAGGVIVVYMLVTVFMLPLFLRAGCRKGPRCHDTVLYPPPFCSSSGGFSWLGRRSRGFR